MNSRWLVLVNCSTSWSRVAMAIVTPYLVEGTQIPCWDGKPRDVAIGLHLRSGSCHAAPISIGPGHAVKEEPRLGGGRCPLRRGHRQGLGERLPRFRVVGGPAGSDPATDERRDVGGEDGGP